ncbi:unnamed protein product [Clonostachys rhizophaga]|uniref:Major facilitator superfamily (MFS) profile domain-containing protein n=1 Tax=Clonostachys rhizophaga TaxID=160324 RepID=A0A9N9VX93_9HYPO|nr:unnamed protein product [Clonostachys rhizophaga]
MPAVKSTNLNANLDVVTLHSTAKVVASTLSEPPDGGLTAWLNVVGSFFLVFNTWGIINAFGAYQTYYSSGDLFSASSSSVSWIGSIETCLLLTTGFLSGPFFDRGGLQTLLVTGCFLIVFGHMMLSICKTYWQVMMAQGVVIGLGTGCLFVPCVAILPQYFKLRMGLASGLAIGGSSIGGIIYPIVFYRLLDNIGFPWAVRTVGFIALATLIVPISLLRMRVKPAKARTLVDWSAFKDADFVSLVAVGFLAYTGLFVLLFYISLFAADSMITDVSLAFYLVAIFNAGSFVGRTVPNALADKTGPFDIISAGAFLVSVFELCMIAVDNQAGLIALSVVAGIFSGILIGILPLCFITLTTDKSKIGTRVGMGFALLSLGVLCGGPGAGAILGLNEGSNWTGVWVFAGVVTCVSGLGFLALRIKVYGMKSILKA